MGGSESQIRLGLGLVAGHAGPGPSDEQTQRYEGDPWEEVIGPWLEHTESTAISEVLEKCISKPQALWTQTDKIRAARCLRAQGWVRYRERQGSRLEWRYRKVG